MEDFNTLKVVHRTTVEEPAEMTVILTEAAKPTTGETENFRDAYEFYPDSGF